MAAAADVYSNGLTKRRALLAAISSNQLTYSWGFQPSLYRILRPSIPAIKESPEKMRVVPLHRQQASKVIFEQTSRKEIPAQRGFEADRALLKIDGQKSRELSLKSPTTYFVQAEEKKRRTKDVSDTMVISGLYSQSLGKKVFV
jgi:hypothetical protein